MSLFSVGLIIPPIFNTVAFRGGMTAVTITVYQYDNFAKAWFANLFQIMVSYFNSASPGFLNNGFCDV